MFLKYHLDELNWQNYHRVPNLVLSQQWRDWVLDRGSLTQRLINYSADNFSVKVLQQSTAIPVNNERKALGLGIRQACLVREVALQCHGTPVVYARSVIPLTSLQGPQRQLAHLGERPLGAFLFRHKNMSRGPLEVAPFDHLLLGDNRKGWGRRSVFYLDNYPLLVAEFFLADLLIQDGTPFTNVVN